MHRFSWHRSLSPPLRSVARSLCHEKHYLTLLNCFLKSWSHIIDKNTYNKKGATEAAPSICL